MGSKFDAYDLDKHRLDEEWVDQPRLYYEQAELLIEARNELERAKSNKDFVVATLGKEVRRHPKEYGLDGRIVNDVVDNTIILQDDYQKAENRLLDAKNAVEEAEAAVKTMDHRKPALENLVRLQLSNYYSDPRPPKGHEEELRKMERRQVLGRKKNNNNDD